MAKDVARTECLSLNKRASVTMKHTFNDPETIQEKYQSLNGPKLYFMTELDYRSKDVKMVLR